MGRKKIQISRITDERNRQVTFNKRKFGVMKKAYELSVLCDCEIALIIFSSSNKLYQYASTDMDKVLLKYTEYNEPHESLTNKNIIEALNKKEHKNGGCSPDSPEGDSEYQLTPRTEAKYSKIDEAFQMMVQKNQIAANSRLEPTNYPLPLSMSMGGYSESSLLQTSPHMGQNSVSPRPSSSEAESVYAGGSMLEMSNGYPNSTSPVMGESPSPGTSPVAQNLQIKIEEKSQPLAPSSLAGRPNLRIIIPNQHEEPNNSAINNTTLNTPVVSLQTSVLNAYPPSLFPDLINSSDLSSAVSTLNWPTMTAHSSSMSHLSVPSVSPTSSPSPSSVHIKSEPNSPPRSEHHPLSHILSQPPHISLTSHHLSQGSSILATDLRHDYDAGPVSKRPRDSWGT